jgi:hypothetical protein
MKYSYNNIDFIDTNNDNVDQVIGLILTDKESTKKIIHELSLKFVNVTLIHFDNCPRLTDYSVSSVNNFINLKILKLTKCNHISSNFIKDLKELEGLYVDQSIHSYDIILFISRFTSLKHLSIISTRFNSSHLKELSKLKLLESLKINNLGFGYNTITDNDLDFLVDLKNLKELNLEYCIGVTKEKIKSLSHLPIIKAHLDANKNINLINIKID